MATEEVVRIWLGPQGEMPPSTQAFGPDSDPLVMLLVPEPLICMTPDRISDTIAVASGRPDSQTWANHDPERTTFATRTSAIWPWKYSVLGIAWLPPMAHQPFPE